MLTGNGGRPMADAQEERLLLARSSPCTRPQVYLRSATPCRARSAPRARALCSGPFGKLDTGMTVRFCVCVFLRFFVTPE